MSVTERPPAISPACQHVAERLIAQYKALVRATLADMQGALGWLLPGVREDPRWRSAYAYTVGIATKRGLIGLYLADDLLHENATECATRAVRTWRDEIDAGAGTLTLSLAKTGKITAKFVRRRAS